MKKSFPSPSNDAALATLAAEWQKRLRLQDWNVHVRFIDRQEKDEEDIGCAITSFHSQFKEVLIRVSQLCDLNEAKGCTDVEVTLVHELLHLCSDPFDHFFIGAEARKARPTEYRALEQMIETIAIALVELKRGVSHKEWS